MSKIKRFFKRTYGIQIGLIIGHILALLVIPGYYLPLCLKVSLIMEVIIIISYLTYEIVGKIVRKRK